MAKKDFTKSIGSKNLKSLIPTDDPVVAEPVTVTASKATAKPIVKRALDKKASPKAVYAESAPTPTPVISKKATAKSDKKSNPTTVTTFRINDDNLFAIKAVAFWERKKIQDVFNDALSQYLNDIPPATLKKALSEFEKRM